MVLRSAVVCCFSPLMCHSQSATDAQMCVIRSCILLCYLVLRQFADKVGKLRSAWVCERCHILRTGE